METRRQAHCVYKTMYHIVFIPRYRYEILNKGVAEYLKTKMQEVRKYYPEIEYHEINIQLDHVHMVIDVPPAFGVPKAVQVIKQNTARELKHKFEFLRRTYYGRGGIWSAGYFVSTVGLDEEMIREYVKYQGEQDAGQTKFVLNKPWT